MPADDKYLKYLELEQECTDPERDVWEWKYRCKLCGKVILAAITSGRMISSRYLMTVTTS